MEKSLASDVMYVLFETSLEHELDLVNHFDLYDSSLGVYVRDNSSQTYVYIIYVCAGFLKRGVPIHVAGTNKCLTRLT